MKPDFLKERAESFLRDADFAIKEKRWFAGAFHLEQAVQLYLKYYLFRKLRDFPKTHSLERLLRLIGEAYKKKKSTEKLLKKHREAISDLQEAYLTARYLPVEFFPEQIEKMKKFTKELLTFLKKL